MKKRNNNIDLSNVNWSNSGNGILTTLQLIFIVLKMNNLINWSWWKVWIPTYISFGIVAILGIIVLILMKHNKKKN